MKDCAFQYWNGREMVEDTDLITFEEGEALWQKYIPEFKRSVEMGNEPEMALWADMAGPGDYRSTARRWSGADFVIRDGDMYSNVPVA